jgi:hypothetical protein
MTNHRAGLIGALLLGLWHAAWSGLVYKGWADGLLGWVFWMHFLTNPFVLDEFSGPRSVVLVLLASLSGYAAGWTVALLVHALARREGGEPDAPRPPGG